MPKKDLFCRATGDMSPQKYGGRYWIVYLTGDREVYLHADRMEVIDGSLAFWNVSHLTNPYLITVFGPGEWVRANGASVIDGSDVNVVHEMVPTEEGT